MCDYVLFAIFGVLLVCVVL